MSELANNKSIRKEVQDLGETLGITPNGKTNQQKIRSIGEQASDGTYATKEYVNTLMSGALKRSIVTTLPVEDIDTNTIYMVLDSEASQQGNVYNEYLYINEAWELIGTTATSGGSDNTFVVTFTDSGNVGADGQILTSNKTFEEIYQAISQGKIVYGLFVNEVNEDITDYYSQHIVYCSKQYNGKTESYDYFFDVAESQIYSGYTIMFSYVDNEFEFQNQHQD